MSGTDTAIDRIPPHSLEHEMATLGSMLLDRNAIDDVMALVGGSDYYRSDHRCIHETIVALYGSNQPVDLITVPEALRQAGKLEDVGGVQYLAELAECVPAACNAEYYAKVVRGRAELRRMISASDVNLRECYEAADEPAEIIARAEARTLSAAERAHDGPEETNAAATARLLDDVLANIGQPAGMPTGLAALDELTGGLHPEYVVIAARPSIGKTAMGTGILTHIAAAGAPVWFGSLEMSANSLRQRIICARAGIENLRIRSGGLNHHDAQRFVEAGQWFGALPVTIDDCRQRRDVQYLCSQIRRAKKRHGIRAAFIDYLQRIDYGADAGNENTALTRISAALARLKDELRIPIVVLAQLNRGPMSRDGFRPRASDLRGSGSLEQDADVILLLHREEFHHKGEHAWLADNEDKLGKAEVIIEKQRNGPTGTVKLKWVERFARFENLDDEGNVPAEWGTPAGIAGATHGSNGYEAHQPDPEPAGEPF